MSWEDKPLKDIPFEERKKFYKFLVSEIIENYPIGEPDKCDPAHIESPPPLLEKISEQLPTLTPKQAREEIIKFLRENEQHVACFEYNRTPLGALFQKKLEG